ncbi:MAG: nucleotide pyrophosphohydrolase [Gemmatimonadetes bacterium]|nr:nucleotide pyrophosphohydrolase [Gemmatimonadota bacterium]
MDRLAAIQVRLRQFSAEREWEQFHDPKNLSMTIASEAGELLAELRWVAGDASDEHVRSAPAREKIEHEVADIAIALLLFCERAKIDLLDAIDRKIGLNAHRYPVELAKGHPDRPASSD